MEKKNYLDIQPNEEEIKKLNSKIKSLLIDNEIEIINLKKANDLISKKDRSTFIFDVTTKKSLKDNVSFIKNVPGGQLVQATDNFVGVLN